MASISRRYSCRKFEVFPRCCHCRDFSTLEYLCEIKTQKYFTTWHDIVKKIRGKKLVTLSLQQLLNILYSMYDVEKRLSFFKAGSGKVRIFLKACPPLSICTLYSRVLEAAGEALVTTLIRGLIRRLSCWRGSLGGWRKIREN